MKLEKIIFSLIIILSIVNGNMFHITKINAWGYSGHKNIAEESAHWLPAPWDTFLNNQVDALHKASVLPDIRKSSDPYEAPRHWDDSDIIHQDYNISGDDPDYQLGVVSWATENATKNLILAIEQKSNTNTLIELFGVLSHYASDAAMPFHATANFNGQLTGNNGIHSRFETSLLERNLNELFSNITLEPLEIIDPYNETESIIASGLEITPTILEADDIAKQDSGGSYDDEYYKSLYLETKNILKARITIAIQHTANLWFTALSLAGAFDEESSIVASSSEETNTSVTQNSKITSTLGFLFSAFFILLIFKVIIRKKR